MSEFRYSFSKPPGNANYHVQSDKDGIVAGVKKGAGAFNDEGKIKPKLTGEQLLGFTVEVFRKDGTSKFCVLKKILTNAVGELLSKPWDGGTDYYAEFRDVTKILAKKAEEAPAAVDEGAPF